MLALARHPPSPARSLARKDFFNTFLALAVLRWSLGPLQILLTDLYPKGPFWPIWDQVFFGGAPERQPLTSWDIAQKCVAVSPARRLVVAPSNLCLFRRVWLCGRAVLWAVRVTRRGAVCTGCGTHTRRRRTARRRS